MGRPRRRRASPGPTNNVVLMGNDKGTLTTFDFFPKVKNVKVGDTVSFEMTKGSSEEHTVTFGPPDYLGPIEQILPDPSTGSRPSSPSTRGCITRATRAPC